MSNRPKGYAKASMYAVKWRHYTKSSRTMVKISEGENKDTKIARLLAELNTLNNKS